MFGKVIGGGVLRLWGDGVSLKGFVLVQFFSVFMRRVEVLIVVNWLSV